MQIDKNLIFNNYQKIESLPTSSHSWYSTTSDIGKGKIGNKEMSLPEVKIWFSNYKKNYNDFGKGNDKEFNILANGFWQAEGYVGGIFRSDLNFYPLCTATQYLTEDSVKFFLRLDNALSNTGTFSITLNKLGKFVIVYILSGWNVFFSTFVPYFSMLYGAKYQAIFKLKKIYELINLIKKDSNLDIVNMNKVLIVKLAYSLTAHSSRYKLSIEDKLKSLNLDLSLLMKVPELKFSENNLKPSFLFILGFFLGDGTLHLKLEWKHSNSSIVIVPLFNVVQSNVESNLLMFEKMRDTLKDMNLKASLTHSSKALELTVKGMDNIFKSLFELLNKYSHFLYWKTDSYNLLLWTSKFIDIGGHHTYYGLKALIDKIYSSTNERFVDKETWDSRLEEWLKVVSARREWGEYYITPIYTSKKEIKGWQVRFPISIKLPKSNKGIMCSTYGGQDKAFITAVQYRNSILINWIKNFLNNN
jgi:hypothetical protein